MKLKLTQQEKLERIKALKKIIKELSKEVNTNETYILSDITSGSVFSNPNQVLLNKIFTYQSELDTLLRCRT